jgi:hypothetical protein
MLGLRAAPPRAAAAACRRAPACAPSASVRPPLRAACRVEASASFGSAAPRAVRAVPRGSRLAASADGDDEAASAAPAVPADAQPALDAGAGGDDGSSPPGDGAGGGGSGGGDGEGEAEEDAEPVISLAEARAACMPGQHCAPVPRLRFSSEVSPATRCVALQAQKVAAEVRVPLGELEAIAASQGLRPQVLVQFLRYGQARARVCTCAAPTTAASVSARARTPAASCRVGAAHAPRRVMALHARWASPTRQLARAGGSARIFLPLPRHQNPQPSASR